MMSLLDMVT